MNRDQASIRAELVRRARSRKTRIVGEASAGFPSRWIPGAVRNPQDGQPFTEPGAWDFVATTLEDGHPFEEIKLHQPAGRTGYVLKIQLTPNEPILYVKLQLSASEVIGRSFHYTDHQ